MNKRELVLNLLDPATPQATTPAAFFIHFDPRFHFGQAAVDKHLEYFRYTDMDLVKIQYEIRFPYQPDIQKPSDWSKLPLLREGFFQPQLAAVEGLVQAAKSEAIVIVTLYSPFMCARQASNNLIEQHLRENPDQAKRGIEIAAESLLNFVRACIRLGVDGFYTSTQGGERERFGASSVFQACIKPFDLLVMEEIDQTCLFNILHVCDYAYDYDELTPFLDYPGHVVNVNQRVGSEVLTGQQIAEMFKRPFMGGLDRKGIIATGSPAAVRQEVNQVLQNAPEKFFLAADCTLPNDVAWENVKTAVATAHNYELKL